MTKISKLTFAIAAILLLLLVGLLAGTATWLIWLPMAAFEIPVGLWFIVRGVEAPARVANEGAR